MCETCDMLIKRIAKAELMKDYQVARVFRELLEGHMKTCKDALVQQLWPGKNVIVVKD